LPIVLALENPAHSKKHFSNSYYGECGMEIITANTSANNTSEKIVVELDNGRTLSFTSELIAKASSSDNRTMGLSWSDETRQWQVLNYIAP
jgi:hypothetical protein